MSSVKAVGCVGNDANVICRGGNNHSRLVNQGDQLCDNRNLIEVLVTMLAEVQNAKFDLYDCKRQKPQYLEFLSSKYRITSNVQHKTVLQALAVVIKNIDLARWPFGLVQTQLRIIHIS